MPPLEYMSIKQLKALRGKKMLLLYIEGKKVSEIAKIFKTSDNSVKESLEHAAASGYGARLEKMESDLIGDLVPLAIKVYHDKLQGDNPDVLVAKDVIDKLVKLGDRQSNNKQHQQKMGLEAYMAQKRIERENDAAKIAARYKGETIDADASPSGDEPSTEAVIVEDLG